MLPALIVSGLSFALGVGLTAVVRWLAPRIGLTDSPDRHRKLHHGPTPLGGGVAVLLVLLVVVAALFWLPNPWQESLHEDWLAVLTFLGLCTAIVAVGLFDDGFGLRGRQKLLLQSLVAFAFVLTEGAIRKVVLFGWDIELGLLSVPCTIVWLVGATNAINLLDGIDGFATVLGVILLGTVAAMAAMMIGQAEVALMAMILAAALAGFLVFNYPPATIFLGDAGSMLIGFSVGVLSLQSSLKGAGTVLLVAPLAIMSLPAFDTGAAIVRRKLTGRSIYTTDRGHLHHRLLDRLGSNRLVLALMGLGCAAISAGVLASAWFKSDAVALIAGLGVIGIFVATGLFGRPECAMLVGALGSVGRSFLRPLHVNQHGHGQVFVRLQGNEQWGEMWETLLDATEKFALEELRFNIDIPFLREGFHASWKRPRTNNWSADNEWRIELPLTAGGRSVGRILYVGSITANAGYDSMDHLFDVTDTVADKIRRLIESKGNGESVRGHDSKSGLSGDVPGSSVSDLKMADPSRAP